MTGGNRASNRLTIDIQKLQRVKLLPHLASFILEFIKDHSFSGADFVIGAEGGCRLSPQLARTVATMVNKHRSGGDFMNSIQANIFEQKRKYQQLNAAHNS